MSKHAYVQTAIFGTPFCKSASEAFNVIVRNAGKVASISYVSNIVLFVGKVFVGSITAGAAYLYIDHELGHQLYSTLGPCILVFFLSFFVGEMFLSIFDMATSTILQCFVVDTEMFGEDECYAEDDLREWIDDFKKKEKKIVTGRRN